MWNVYLNGKKIDTVMFEKSYTAEQVKWSLIDHDGYDRCIVVEKVS